MDFSGSQNASPLAVVGMEQAKPKYKFTVGEILVLRTTGERVVVLDRTKDVYSLDPEYSVRRPSQNAQGHTCHERETYKECELSTLEDYGNAQVDEIFLKRKIEARLDREVPQAAEPATIH